MRIQPPSVLQAGPSGSGKTSAIATQLLCGVRSFVVVTEPDGVASLLDACERLKAPVDMLHWMQCTPASSGWMELEDMLTKVNSMDQKGLADMRDLGKSAFKAPGLRFLNCFRNFTCDRTGQDFGDFTRWTDNCFMNIDSMTGMNMIFWGLTVGYKPTANPGEWGIAQNAIHSFLNKINSDRACFFGMTAHVEKEMDEMSGVKKVMISSIGAKLAPKIPPFFSEFVRCARVMDNKGGASFTWSTLATDMDLKNRALPIGAILKADFEPVIAAHRRRVQMAGGAPSASAVPPAGAASANASAPKMPQAPLNPSTAQGLNKS